MIRTTAIEPLVSIIIPVFNAQRYLGDALGSIEAQTYRHLEIIAVNDGSTDNSAEILHSFRKRDARLVVIHHPSRRGVGSALNTGLRRARGTLVARMDSDDISEVDRINNQVSFLTSHADVDVLGTGITIINVDGGIVGRVSPPPTHWAIRFYLLFSSPMLHPTVMRRWPPVSSQFCFYPETNSHAEDYELWAQIVESQTFHNLKDYYLRYRIHERQVSAVRAKALQTSAYSISRRLISAVAPSVNLTWEETQAIYRLLSAVSEGVCISTLTEISPKSLIALRLLLMAFISTFSPADKFLIDLAAQIQRIALP